MTATASPPCGTVRGEIHEGLHVFRGLPFAAPPVAALRFRPPQPPEPWSGVRDATRFGCVPFQASDPISTRLGLTSDGPQGEDCLTLNLWSPGLDGARRPVMIWIHGGAFICGTGNAPAYTGHHLAARGDVVVVTLNYRVGALGFLYLDELLEEAGETDTANLGLRDQVAALRWVRDNVEAFGGDPDNVTLFGESAGGGSICSLLAMPEARGLFGRAIIQSAAPAGMIRAEEATRRGHELLRTLDLGDRVDSKQIRKIPVEAILDAQARCAANGPYETGMFFAPVVEGKTLPAKPLDEIREGCAAAVEIIVGTTREEMQLYRWGSPGGSVSDGRVRRTVAFQVPGDAGNGRTRADFVVDSYRALRKERGASLSGLDLRDAIQTDLSLRYPATQLAERQAKHQPRTYMYLFTWPSPLQDGDLGSCHTIDLPFTFGTLEVPGMADLAGAGLEAERLAGRVMDAWTAFARCGDPSHDAIGPWRPYEPDRRSTMLLGDPCRLEDAPLEGERAVWDRI